MEMRIMKKKEANMATQRISFDMDADEYKYLKMCCAKMGVKLKDFITKATLNSVYEEEDKWFMDEKPYDQEGENHLLIDHQGNFYAV
jgi:hypothetical protein